MKDVLKVEHIEWVKLLPSKQIKYPLMISGVPSLKLKELLEMGFRINNLELFGHDGDYYGPRKLLSALAGYYTPAVCEITAGYSRLQLHRQPNYNVKPANIGLVGGANMAIYMACAVLLKAGDEVIIELPSYEPIRRAAESVGAKIKYLHRRLEDKFQPDPAELKKLISPRTRLVMITNLHNPSGVRLDDDVAQGLIDVCDKHGVHIACDEIYLDFLTVQGILKDKPAPFFTRHPLAITLSSLTKVYGLGYMRTGWVMADPKVVYRVQRAYDYMTASDAYPAQMISLFCLRHINKLIDRTRELIGNNLDMVKAWADSEMAQGRLSWYPPDGGIIALMKLPHGINSMRFVQHLYKHYNTVVVPGEYLGTPGYIRLGFGVKPGILREGLRRISRCLSSKL